MCCHNQQLGEIIKCYGNWNKLRFITDELKIQYDFESVLGADEVRKYRVGCDEELLG